MAAGGLVAAGAIPAASASPAAASITIATKSALPAISGHTVVVFATSGLRTATISGTITGASPGDVATLWSKPFGATTFTATSSTVALATTPQAYGFTVRPSRATAYEVRVTTGATIDGTSSAAKVFVIAGGHAGPAHKTCTRTTCTYGYRAFEILPAAAYKTEVHKRVYLYLAVGYPKLPGRYTLDTADRASAPTKISPTEFRVTLTWHITLHRGSARWQTLACTKDTESSDGLGLPGHHGCGDKYISRSAVYAG
jgi:hypothetical protein